MKRSESRFLSCMYVLSLFLLAGFAFNGLRQVQPAASVQPASHTIILDAGHGGPDGGASGTDGTKESTLNLTITLKIDGILGLLGEKTILIRDTDRDISDPECQSISQKKVSDIRNRVSIINSCTDGILVSVHCNFYPESKYKGAQIFYNSEDGAKSLAQAVQSGIAEHTDPENQRQVKQVSGEIYLFRHAQVPGILVECGFLSNPQELSLLKTEEYQKKLALSIAIPLSRELLNLSQV